MAYMCLSHFCHNACWVGSAGEVALPSTILKRSSDSRMTSTSFCHVDQFGGEQVSFGLPYMRL